MMPSNIINGFKVCGVYPFNPKAVLDHDPCTPPKETSEQRSTTSGKGEQQINTQNKVTPHKETSELRSITSGEEEQWINGQNEVTVSNNGVVESFSPEEQTLFARRYEEGYNLYDARYVSWIQATHPKDANQELLFFQILVL